MDTIDLRIRAGQVSAELARLGISPATQVHVTVELEDDKHPGAAIAEAGGSFAWLADEPDLYTLADILPEPE